MEEGAIEACQIDDLLYPERSIHHLDFSPSRVFFAYSCTSTFFLIDLVMKSLLKCVWY